jgi:MFS family permease
MPTEKTSEETYIINESPEISIGEKVGWFSKLRSTFPALENRNYKLYFYGQLVSMIGTWLQIVAQSWLVLQLTNSAFLIGLVMALSTLPTLFFTLFGGVIVDRFSKKKILLFTQSIAMVLAFVLGLLTVLGWINVWEICVISFLLGVVNAIDAPARQSFVSEMVSKEQLSSAIALNSGIFNAARVIGPSVAGLLIAVIGTGGAFLVNSASYIAVIIALQLIRIKHVVKENNTNAFEAVKEGIQYTIAHPIIRTLIIFIGIISVFGWSYTTVLPIIAKNTFHMEAAGLGYLYAATGAGSFLSTILVGIYSKKISPVLFILGGVCIFSVSLIVFTFITNPHWAAVLLFFVGFGLLSFASMSNTVIQTLVKNEFRGRVMSIYILMFIGMIPLGNFQIGWVSEKFTTDIAIRIGAVIVLLAGLFILIYKNKIQEQYNRYKERDGNGV